jgi:gas vesicle protein
LSRSRDGLKTVGKKLEGLIQEEGNELIVAKQKSLAATKKSADLVKKSLPLIKELTKLYVHYFSSPR